MALASAGCPWGAALMPLNYGPHSRGKPVKARDGSELRDPGYAPFRKGMAQGVWDQAEIWQRSYDETKAVARGAKGAEPLRLGWRPYRVE